VPLKRVRRRAADIAPLRPQGATSAYLSVMRGCGNFCSFCIVPHARARPPG
jgi:tRNA A37 methylthiotransferase MiaB